MTEAGHLDFAQIDLQEEPKRSILESSSGESEASGSISVDNEKISSASKCSRPSKGMLLRLFQSDLFTAAQAVHYLGRYSDAPGIQFHLCNRLKMMAFDDVRFLLPQLW